MTDPGLLDREVLLERLYAAESTSSDPDLTGVGRRTGETAQRIWEARSELDEITGLYARGWRVERMPAVDRNVLRIGVYELVHTDTPVGVVIDEAVELAKRYSTARSGAFVNGVLDAVRAAYREG